eukprot:SAG31_NODE_2812_length_5052_cov_2.155663_3_plen_261_part_00
MEEPEPSPSPPPPPPTAPSRDYSPAPEGLEGASEVCERPTDPTPAVPSASEVAGRQRTAELCTSKKAVEPDVVGGNAGGASDGASSTPPTVAGAVVVALSKHVLDELAARIAEEQPWQLQGVTPVVAQRAAAERLFDQFAAGDKDQLSICELRDGLSVLLAKATWSIGERRAQAAEGPSREQVELAVSQFLGQELWGQHAAGAGRSDDATIPSDAGERDYSPGSNNPQTHAWLPSPFLRLCPHLTIAATAVQMMGTNCGG